MKANGCVRQFAAAETLFAWSRMFESSNATETRPSDVFDRVRVRRNPMVEFIVEAEAISIAMLEGRYERAGQVIF
jgi:hypothetical protein